MPQNILHTNKQGEKLLHRSVWFVESLEKLYTGGGGVHSWFLMCVYLLRLLGTLKENKKKGSSSSSLMHCHYNISTWKARDPQISRHWTKTLEIPVSLMMERWTENTTWNMWEAPDRRQISVSSVPSVFEFAFFKNTKYHRPRSQSSICRDRER